MAARTSVACVVLGVINIAVALVPMCAGCGGLAVTIGQTQGNARMDVQGRDVGPQLKAHIERNLPTFLPEAIGAMVGNTLFCLLLCVGAVGLFLTQSWGRWVSLGAAFLLILTLCVHDIYQIAIVRPVLDEFFDTQLRNMPADQRTGFKIGFAVTYFMWSCLNPLLVVYLFGMSLFLMVTSAFNVQPQEEPRPRRRRSREYDDPDDDDRPPRPRRRGYDDDEDY